MLWAAEKSKNKKLWESENISPTKRVYSYHQTKCRQSHVNIKFKHKRRNAREFWSIQSQNAFVYTKKFPNNPAGIQPIMVQDFRSLMVQDSWSLMVQNFWSLMCRILSHWWCRLLDYWWHKILSHWWYRILDHWWHRILGYTCAGLLVSDVSDPQSLLIGAGVSVTDGAALLVTYGREFSVTDGAGFLITDRTRFSVTDGTGSSVTYVQDR